ncbi:hypothetical protein [Bacillus sp. V2I10]|uniref:hypothetical protein n=1 Tax=Bacillus sp. V2I10 TaxID=3042276 RepID=UPI002783F40F|nr:hypothetical protein [Bacillus sp. V2I10]MDQ0861165.1 hypothetical protein [Bacillus sp. V2I10]
MSTNHSEFSEIPKVELVNFSFSPPGPMGWSSAEYETMLEDPETFLSKYKIRHAEPANGNVELIELPLKKRKPQEAIMSVEPINEVMQETVQSLSQEAAAEMTKTEEQETAVKAEDLLPAASHVTEYAQESAVKAEDMLPAVSHVTEQGQEPAVKAEDMFPAAGLVTEQAQEPAASDQSLSDSVKFTGSRAKQVYSYDKLIDLFNQSDQGSNQSSKNQEQSGLRFTSSRRKSKSGPSARKNKVLFLG